VDVARGSKAGKGRERELTNAHELPGNQGAATINIGTSIRMITKRLETLSHGRRHDARVSPRDPIH
jgi:hypothetical protein